MCGGAERVRRAGQSQLDTIRAMHTRPAETPAYRTAAAAMAPPRDPNPSTAALRKRERRAAEKREDLEAFLEKQRKQQQEYRARKGDDQQAAIDAAGPAAGPAPPKAREELAKCRAEVCTATSKALTDFFNERVNDSAAARAAAPELKKAVVQAATGTRAVFRIEQALNKADLSQRLYEHSRVTDGG